MEDEVNNTRKVVYGILEFLDGMLKEPTTPTITKESLEVAVECLETAYGVTLKDDKYRLSRSLMDMVRSPSSSTTPAGTNAASASTAFNPLAAFAGGFPINISNGEDYQKPPEATEADKNIADDLKNKGNDAMKNASFGEALDHYNKAIELDGNNAAYFCNRAAAFIKLEDYEKGIRDCQIAAQLQPSYARAYGRMGVCFSSQNKNVDAFRCYKKALELEPESESYKTNLRTTQQIMMRDLPTTVAEATNSQLIKSLFGNDNNNN